MKKVFCVSVLNMDKKIIALKKRKSVQNEAKIH